MTRHLDTSREAYREVIPTLSARQAEVLAVLETSSPLTNAELAEKLGWSVNRITPRVLELREIGRVQDFGKRRCRVTGRSAYQWGVAGTVPPKPAKPRVEYVEIDGVMHARFV